MGGGGIGWRSDADNNNVYKDTDGRPHVQAVFDNSNTVDAFGRLRVSNPIGVFENKNIHSKSDNQWEEPIVGAIIEHGTVTDGPFQVAETITGDISGTTGTITAVNGGALTVTYTVNHDDFEVAETIAGGTSGATAAITTVGTGSTVFFTRDEAAVTLQVGQLNGDSAVRTSHRYFPYIPGKSHLVFQTFLFGVAVTNVRRRVGYFEPENGIYLEQTTGLRIVRRTKTSGSVVNNEIEQTKWNQDKLDGTGASRINLDFTKTQFLCIDFQWQGTGRVRVGFVHNGQIILAHIFDTSNTLDVPWMSTPSLPVRYEIENTGATGSINTMKEFCTSVVSEGGEKLTGMGFTISRGTTPRAVTTEVPVLAIRLKSSFGGGDNRKTVQFSNASIFVETNNAHFEIKHIHGPTGITATWTDIGGGSAVEYSTDITAVTGNPAHAIEEGYSPAGGAPGKGGNENVVSGDKLDQHRLITQNIDSTNSEMFIVTAIAITGTSNIYAHISWVEFD